jgi:hypothetical protein
MHRTSQGCSSSTSSARATVTTGTFLTHRWWSPPGLFLAEHLTPDTYQVAGLRRRTSASLQQSFGQRHTKWHAGLIGVTVSNVGQPEIARELLFQVNLWWALQDLNLRPQPCEGCCRQRLQST